MFYAHTVWLVPRGVTLASVRDEPVLKGGGFSPHSLVPVGKPALKASSALVSPGFLMGFYRVVHLCG